MNCCDEQYYGLEYPLGKVESLTHQHARTWLPQPLHGVLVMQMNATVAAYSFLISLDFLNGKERLVDYSAPVFALARY